MLVSTTYIKRKGERSYKRFSQNTLRSSSIDDYLKFFPTSRERKPDNVVKVKYSNFGRTFTRIVKNKRTGNSKMLVLREKIDSTERRRKKINKR